MAAGIDDSIAELTWPSWLGCLAGFKLRRLTMLWNGLLAVTSSGLATLCDKLGLGTADNYGPLAKWCPRRI